MIITSVFKAIRPLFIGLVAHSLLVLFNSLFQCSIFSVSLRKKKNLHTFSLDMKVLVIGKRQEKFSSIHTALLLEKGKSGSFY